MAMASHGDDAQQGRGSRRARAEGITSVFNRTTRVGAEAVERELVWPNSHVRRECLLNLPSVYSTAGM